MLTATSREIRTSAPMVPTLAFLEMLKVMNPARKSTVCRLGSAAATIAACLTMPPREELPQDSKKRIPSKKKRDNPHSDRFIEVGTKALRRETDVWGDAAGTAPAVTSVTSLSPSSYFWALHLGAPFRRAFFFAPDSPAKRAPKDC